MAVKWLRELEKENPHLAMSARRLNAEDGFVMGSHRRRSDKDKDGDDTISRGKGKRKKHGKSESGSSCGSDEDGRESGSHSSSYYKKGRKSASDDSREGSFTPP